MISEPAAGRYLERQPQRFFYVQKSGAKRFGVVYPVFGGWQIETQLGRFGMFTDCPWEIMGELIGEFCHFEWIDNEHRWKSI